eukprot:SRR837773.25095.p1 GENE.SRR837773.25095~~SRR837773.25095.p1  ORF type:complete len:379 (+),score=107.34 SRR837773.25095:3-1139(+)
MLDLMSRLSGLFGWLTSCATGAPSPWLSTKGRTASQPFSFLGLAGWLLGPRALATLGGGTSPRARKNVLVRNGEVQEPGLSKDELLKRFGGAYTTARTVDQSSIFELAMHCSRLHDTAKAVWSKQAADPQCGAAVGSACRSGLRFLQDGGLAGLKPLLRREIGFALKQLEVDDCKVEFQVTVLLTVDSAGPHTPNGRGFDMFTFVQPMPTTVPMVDVLACRADRSNPTIKDVGWVRARSAMEERQKQTGVNEVLMYDAEFRVTEGLQTNFFAVAEDGALLTAPDELVLAGTVRKIVLEVAEQNGIPVRMQCPDIQQLDTWDSCFICSTSRLVKPILSVEAPELGSRRRFPGQGSVAHRVEALVLAAFRSHAEPLEGDD